ncbi:MAG: hypothetical protein ACQEQC_04550 [Elusimicrobiota bacterium]
MGNNKKQKNTEIVKCPDCGKKVRKSRTNFCPSCGREIFIPSMEKNWNYKILAGIFIAVTLLYLLYSVFKPAIYFYLDKV